MNNKPVAWIVDGVLFNSLGAALNISFDIEQPCIPLYTHPVKELTDEKIHDLMDEIRQAVGDDIERAMYRMARAILKKAQENG